MTLEQQVTSLELSKKLKELGVKQESYFWWINEKISNEQPAKGFREASSSWYSAFTASELGEMLRPHLKKSIWLDQISESMEKATYMEDEANSRAEMLIYLLENKLIAL